MDSRTAARGTRRFGVALALLLAVLALAPAAAQAADAFFPGAAPPPTQVTRDFTLKEAAQRGLIKLESKGLGGEGDAVSLELQHKKVRGPITVTLRVEFTVPARVSAELREAVANTIRDLAAQTEAGMNQGQRTSGGDPVRFKLLWDFRAPEAAGRFNYHQVNVINPSVDGPEPDPNRRPSVDHLATPNKFGQQSGGTFTTGKYLTARILAHEMLHLAGLDDRYADFYRVNGKDYPLPEAGMSPSRLRAFARSHRPPLPLPPAGGVLSKNLPGTSRCDIMGTGAYLDCRKISRRDLDWFESQAGVQVTAQPGDLLLNKDSSRQNMGVGFSTSVYARPGTTTTANGISVYCIDKDLFFPAAEGFDVLGPARELPGYEPLAALLELSGRIQPSLEETPPGMLNAVWNVTDAAELEFSGSAAESRALLAQAGVAENAVPGGLPYVPNPNAGSAETGAVAGGEVLPAIGSATTKPAAEVRINYVRLYPGRVRAGRRVRADMLLSTAGDVRAVSVRVERRQRGRWRKVRSLRPRRVETGQTLLPQRLGRLQPGTHRLVVSVTDSLGTAAKVTVSLPVRRG
jgi:hypothetical protein